MTSPVVPCKEYLLIVKAGCPLGEGFQTHSRAVSGRIQSRMARGQASEETPQSCWQAAKPLQSHMVLSIVGNHILTQELQSVLFFSLCLLLSFFFALGEVTCRWQPQLKCQHWEWGRDEAKYKKGKTHVGGGRSGCCTRAQRKWASGVGGNTRRWWTRHGADVNTHERQQRPIIIMIYWRSETLWAYSYSRQLGAP